MTLRHALGLTLAALALAACGGGQKQEDQTPPPAAPEPETPPGQVAPPAGEDAPPPPTEQGGAGGMGMGPGGMGMRGGGMCLADVPGTTLTVEDTSDGVALRFTNAAETAEVRRRVHHMAEMHEMHRVRGGPGPGPMAAMPAAPHTTRAQDVEGGAMLVMVPAAAGDMSALRTQVRELASAMQAGNCPMMEHGGAAPMEDGVDVEEAPGAGE